MTNNEVLESIIAEGRSISVATTGDVALGRLMNLPGVWSNTPNLPGRGWNMIALPFEGGALGYRLLLNQYNETLKFTTVDKGVPNRGILDNTDGTDGDQFVVALDYLQTIEQIKVKDFPESNKQGSIEDGKNKIHHEPGFWLHMKNKTTNNIDLARLATIPHGNSVLALGHSNVSDQPPTIPNISGLPIGVDQSLDSTYLEPYKFFNDNLFEGLFNPVHPNLLLEAANQGVNIVKTTKLEVTTTIEDAGISNIPFVTKEADATEMKSTFWLQELEELDGAGNPKLRLQYSQTVFLDFFPRRDGVPGSIRWPHVSINTLEKVSD
jgi:hypothetical protein